MYLIEEILSAFITVLAFVLTVISYLSYRRKSARKLLFITIAFALFFLQGIVLSIALFCSSVMDNLLILVALLDTGILLILYLSVVKR